MCHKVNTRKACLFTLFTFKKIFLSVEHSHVPMEFKSNQPFIVCIIVIIFIISTIFLKLKGRNNHRLYAEKDIGGYHCYSPIYLHLEDFINSDNHNRVLPCFLVTADICHNVYKWKTLFINTIYDAFTM